MKLNYKSLIIGLIVLLSCNVFALSAGSHKLSESRIAVFDYVQLSNKLINERLEKIPTTDVFLANVLRELQITKQNFEKNIERTKAKTKTLPPATAQKLYDKLNEEYRQYKTKYNEFITLYNQKEKIIKNEVDDILSKIVKKVMREKSIEFIFKNPNSFYFNQESVADITKEVESQYREFYGNK